MRIAGAGIKWAEVRGQGVVGEPYRSLFRNASVWQNMEDGRRKTRADYFLSLAFLSIVPETVSLKKRKLLLRDSE